MTNATFMQTCNRIKQLRKEKGLTQEAFAHKIKRDKSTVSKLESGEIELSPMIRLAICNVFAVREQWLLHGEEPVYDDRWKLLEERAQELGEDIYMKLITAKAGKNRLQEIYEELPKEGPPGIAEEGATFTFDIKSQIAENNRAIIEKWLGQIKRIIEEGDYRKASAVQSLLEVLDPEGKKKEE